MKSYLLNLWDMLRASFWFVPAVLGVIALGLGLAMPWFDRWLVTENFPYPDWISTTTSAARATLSAVAGATVAVTGTVFSITVVSLSLTSQQFGPRLLRTFMRDRTTQWTLGVFLSTALYCLLVLRVIEDHDGRHIAPHLSVALGSAMAVLCMALLIVFVHHSAMRIQAPSVVEAVAEDLDASIVRLFPEKIGQPDLSAPKEPTSPDLERVRQGRRADRVRSTCEGYIQAVDGGGLMDLARQHDLLLELHVRPGDFLRCGTLLATVWRARRFDDDAEPLPEEIAPRLNGTIIVGMRRTPRQDVECAINELVEVAVRALSPGINDPFTAINCIDRLGACLSRVSERRLPTGYREDQEGHLRLILRPTTFRGVLDAAFNQIRQYGRESVSVTIRLLEALASIADSATRDEDRAAIRLHADMIWRSAQAALPEPVDVEQVKERYDEILATLDAQSRSRSPQKV